MFRPWLLTSLGAFYFSASSKKKKFFILLSAVGNRINGCVLCSDGFYRSETIKKNAACILIDFDVKSITKQPRGEGNDYCVLSDIYGFS